MVKPAARASSTDRSTLARSWVRPSACSTWAEVDCTPKDSRFTPPAR